ncbi:MAG: hydrolase [Myxococcales bacterium]|nr:hydrolase [Myxococcales bacterium]
MPKSFACPCCGCLTLDEAPPGTFAVCPVCDWEDDDVQCGDPSYRGGANGVSLDEARANFRAFGAVTTEAVARVRLPRPNEVPPS